MAIDSQVLEVQVDDNIALFMRLQVGGRLQATAGGLSLELRLGHDAETADPTLVWCPEERVLAAGDTVMTGSFPIFGQPSQREGLENPAWVKALDQVRALQPLHTSPGHGPVAHEAELLMLERICRYFLDEVKRQIKRRKEPDPAPKLGPPKRQKR